MKEETKLIQAGRNLSGPGASVNVPVHRASTILYDDVQSYLGRFDGDRRFGQVTYGATGTQNARALASAISELEQAAGTVVTATGLSSCTLAIAAVVKAGDHILVTDSVYGPTRKFCADVLARFGVEAEFYDPNAGGEIATLCRQNTTLIFLEAPGSLTFEMQDIAAITSVARERGILVAMDNTWATPLFYKPLQHGVDISIQAGTKYVAGHSDLVIGLISANSDTLFKQIADYAMTVGDVAGPDDCFLALRGLRTMNLRLREQYDATLQITNWLHEQPQVKQVLYPPLPDDPGHALWQAQFTGGASLFGLTLKDDSLAAAERLINPLSHFKIGSSWGGYESLVAVNRLPLVRDVVPWNNGETLLRFHIGLEHRDDLIEDLATGLSRV
jgi:cystathionine beta-lyase